MGTPLRRARHRRRWAMLAAAFLVCFATFVLTAAGASAQLSRAQLAERVPPPYQLGEPVPELDGVWTVANSGGGAAGYIFESLPLAPIPGFAGQPMNLLITIDREGRFLDVTVLAHNEPIFVAGLGPAPLQSFLTAYRGHSFADSIIVGTPEGSVGGEGSAHVYLDGVTKATASVRIANESILAAARMVARARLQGLATGPAARPRPDTGETLDWATLVADGTVRRLPVTNAELQKAFAGTVVADADAAALADPTGTYLDLWVVDVGPAAIGRAVLAPSTDAALRRNLRADEEPILLLANGRHRLLDDGFVRNTVPERIAAGTPDGLTLTLRHADVDIALAPGMPAFNEALILRADTRLGFDPVRPWTLNIRAVREHGSFRPEAIGRDFSLTYQAPAHFFDVQEAPRQTPVWLAALREQAWEIALLVAFAAPLAWLLARRLRPLARSPRLAWFRLAVLAATLVFVGWVEQGQLSIVTPLALLRGVMDGGSLAFLLYSPFLLAVWIITLVSLVAWGRGLFCGWLCPFGALQELAFRAARLVGLPQRTIHPDVDRRLKRVKYGLLAILIVATVLSTGIGEVLAEVEPFKTAITLYFLRPPFYVAYAALWVILGLVYFKPFCRYVCPLGAALAVAGSVRRLDWIRRRAECGSPCQFCRARCAYGAIRTDGSIDYGECFQCLDCVTIIERPDLCVPDRLMARRGRRIGREAP